MARTVKQWKREVTSVFESEGGKKVVIKGSGGSHLETSAEFDLGVMNGGIARLTLCVSMSPSHTSAGHRVRRDLRRLIQSYQPKKSDRERRP